MLPSPFEIRWWFRWHLSRIPCCYCNYISTRPVWPLLGFNSTVEPFLSDMNELTVSVACDVTDQFRQPLSSPISLKSLWLSSEVAATCISSIGLTHQFSRSFIRLIVSIRDRYCRTLINFLQSAFKDCWETEKPTAKALRCSLKIWVCLIVSVPS